MKIVYCTDSICYPGGIPMVTIVKANALAKIEGNEVYIVVTDNKRPPLKELNNVTLIDLDVNYFEDDYKGWWYVMKGIVLKRRLHQQRLEKVLSEIQPDLVISTGTSEKNFLPSVKVTQITPPVFVREIHSEKNYRLRAASSWIAKSMAYIANWYDYDWKISRYDRIIVLTDEDKQSNWSDGKVKVDVMPNPVTGVASKISDGQPLVVVAAGRLTAVKNFSSLIRIWKRVSEKHPNWRLEIWGTGGLQKDLEEQIKNLDLVDNVYLKGYTSEILEKMSEASIFCLSSNFEGFPLVLVEAMSVGLPVVSYACPTGPKDIITDGADGFLVPLGDEELFAKKLCTLIEDKEIRKAMGAAALKTSEKYKIDMIAERWMQLFNYLKKSKKKC